MIIETEDQAYEFFVQESTELLHILEQGLMNLSQVHDMQTLHALMRAAHSIKGGAACVGLMGIQQIAHNLENGIRALYAEETVFDLALEELLLQAFDCLRSPIVKQIETGVCDQDAALAQSLPFFEQLEAKLGRSLEEAAELPEVPMEGDMTAFLFEEEVPSGLRRWENVLQTEDSEKILAELKTQSEVFSTLGSMLGLPGFTAIAETTLKAIEINPQACHAIGQVALEDLWVGREAVLEGDRTQGGEPSETLIQWTISQSADGDGMISEDEPDDLFILPPVQGIEKNGLEASTHCSISELLLQGFEGLRSPLLEQIKMGHWPETAIASIQVLVQQLEETLECSLNQLTQPLEIDPNILANADLKPDQVSPEFRLELKTHLDVFITLGQMLNQPQLTQLASASLNALEQDPEATVTIGLLAFAGIYSQQKAVVDFVENPQLTSTATLTLPRPKFPVSEEELESLVLTTEEDLDDEINPRNERLDLQLDAYLEVEAVKPELDETHEEELDHTLDHLAENHNENEAFPLDFEVIEDLLVLEEDAHLTVENSENITVEENDSHLEIKTVENDESAGVANDNGNQPILSDLSPKHHIITKDEIYLESTSQLSPVSSTTKPPIKPQLSLGVRVDINRLDQLNTLVGELATQDNSLLLQNQKKIESLEQLEKSRELFRKLSVEIQSQARFLAQQKSSNPRVNLASSTLSKALQNTLDELDQIRGSIYDMKLMNLQSKQIIKKRQQTLQKVQKTLTETRMIPVESLLNRFPRMIRDLSVRTQKSVKLELSGQKTLVDKAILEKLYDPLVHLIRNALDHGIEIPEFRLAQDKQREGKIEIRAYHQGNYTYIEVQDNGQGIDPDKIRAKAINKQLISQQDALRLSQKQLYELLFYPGFTTTDKVSELSGRGVGLEAVRRQIEALKGTISIQSELGKGTKFTLRLPWTLTITKLLVFRVENSLFSIPMDALAGIVSISAEEIKTDTKHQKIYDWYGQDVPLVQPFLLEYHHPFAATVTPSSKNYQRNQSQNLSSKVMLLLISQGLETIALKIDQVLMEQNLTIKPFDKVLAAPPFCYGCTILGDGRLVPVVDSPELLEYWRQQQQSHLSELTSISNLKLEPNPRPTILVIDDSLTTRQSLSSLLQKAGYEVLQAKQGREGLTQLHRYHQVEVVICDLEMPEMNGFEFLTHCRREYSKDQLPVMIITSRNNDRHRQLAQQLGSNEYMTKPWQEQELISTLQQLKTGLLLPV